MTKPSDRAPKAGPEVRRSAGRPKLPVERITAAALEIADAEGVEALSMRVLAQRLGSGTATLYRHFDRRATLVAKVVDEVFGEVDIDSDALTAMGWQAACRAVAHAMFDALGRHRNVALLLVEDIPLGPNAMVLREHFLAALLNGGFTPKVAAHSYATLARHVLGFALQLGGHGSGGGDVDASATFHAVDPSRFPATAAVADSLPVPLREEFSFGLDLLIEGLDQLRGR